MEKEFWKNIPRYSSLYQASTYGRIRRHPRMVNNHGTLVVKKGCVIGLRKSSAGYLRARIYDNGKLHEELVHNLVAETFLPNKRHLPKVIHKDGDKSNNRLENLAWSKHCDQRRQLPNKGRFL